MEDMTESTPAEPQTEQRLKDAFTVLEQAVEAETDGDQWPTASKVRLAMKRLTYNGFDHRQLGFRRFRDFLRAADEAGHVVLRSDHPGDIVVAAAGATSPRPTPRRVRIRRDLWQATLDWKPDVDHYLDLDADRALALPTRPVLLEPEHLRQLRQRVADDDPRLVKVPRIGIGTQLSWMKDHAAGLEESPLKILLIGALDADKPAKQFAAILREEPAAQDRWFNILAINVLAHLQEWKDGDLRLADVRLESTQSRELAARSDGDAARTARHSLGRELMGSASHSRAATTPEERLRAILHRAIDQMPEAELRAIRLPVGYIVGDR